MTIKNDANRREPWLRETHVDLDPLRRQVIHALELAGEDIERWATGFSDEQMGLAPFGAAPVGFHLRHIARSLDRLLSYAEDAALNEAQRAALMTELQQPMPATAILDEVRAALAGAMERVLLLGPEKHGAVRWVGRERIRTTAGGLLIHVAEHTQRHVGQVITTARVVCGLAESSA